MSIVVTVRFSRNKKKKWYTLEWGKEARQRIATGIFTYTSPRDLIQKNHNKESLRILEIKRSQLVLEHQSIGTGYIPSHKYKNNFLDYFSEFVNNNRRNGSRHLEGSFNHFKKFLNKDCITPAEITENLCFRYRKYLLDKFNGDTPANYFTRFKKVLKAATKEGYFRVNPVEDLTAKSNPNKKLKEHLEADEYIKLISTPCVNSEVKEAFVCSCYTAFRWVDVELLDWIDIKGLLENVNIEQKKTKVFHWLELHPTVRAILERRKRKFGVQYPTGKIFNLPTHDGANKVLKKWVSDAGIKKHITWHCARLSFSILLQDANVDLATIACMLGQTSTKYVHSTYKRHRPKDHKEALQKLPSFSGNDNFESLKLN